MRHILLESCLVRAALAAALALTLQPGAAAQQMRRESSRWNVQLPDQVTSKTLDAGSAPLVTVDNLTGPITVTADGGNQIRFTATETVYADSQQAAADAQRDVHLDVTPASDRLTLFVDGPFRCGDDGHTSSKCGDHWSWHWDNPGYEVRFAFELHVPQGARLDLRTVNGGDIAASGTRGDFAVRNVNGGVDLEQMAGSGQATTVNGPVTASFTANPRTDCLFRSVNGKLSLYFPASLGADLSYKTVNGSVYSDFAVRAESSAAPVSESRNGMRVIRSSRESRGRIGAGGPQIALNTVNGSIFIHERK
ncbi:MAG TPA: hypothetical protein VN690_13170 [Terriglobales bacterium]|nr:hypothetical protein [Terriglobales bacterium]